MNKNELNELDTEIREMERAVSFDNSVSTKQKLLALKVKYEVPSKQKAEDSLLRLNQTFYEQGEKPCLPGKSKNLIRKKL